MSDLLNIAEAELEKIIRITLEHNGFKIQKVFNRDMYDYSLFAINEKIFFKAKYIIRFKKANEMIEKYDLMDLLGDLIDVGADKAIFITTGKFSDEAKEFANKIRVELIDYINVAHLISEYNLTNDSKKFYNMEGFDKKRYFEIREKMSKGGEGISELDMQKFLQQYIENNCYEINKSGLIDEYILLLNICIEKETERKTRRVISQLERYKFYKSYLYLLKGDIFNSLRLIIEIQSYLYNTGTDINTLIEWMKFKNNSKEDKEFYDSSMTIILRNFFAIFRYFDFEEGVKCILSYFESDVKLIRKYRKEFSVKINSEFDEDEYNNKINQDIEYIKSNQDIEYIMWPIDIRIKTLYNKFRFKYKKSRWILISEVVEKYNIDIEKVKDELRRNKDKIISLIQTHGDERSIRIALR